MNHTRRQMVSRAGALVVASLIVGCDRASLPVDPTSAPATRASAATTLPASVTVTIDGTPFAFPTPIIIVSDRGAVLNIELIGQTPATLPATQSVERETGYHLIMTVPVGSVEDLPTAAWAQELTEFPEDSADGFFLNGGAEQVVPSNVRADFALDGPMLRIHLRGSFFRRSEDRSPVTTVEVEATFVGEFEVK